MLIFLNVKLKYFQIEICFRHKNINLTGEKRKYEMHLHSINKLAHNLRIARKSDGGNCGKRQLQTHDGVQYVVHVCQIFQITKKGQAKRGHNCEGTSEKYSLPSGPLEI